MMDMLMSGAALALLAFLIVAVGIAIIVVRVIGGRQVQGDHPGERGYDPEQHRHD